MCRLIRRDREKQKTNFFVLFANGKQKSKIKHHSGYFQVVHETSIQNWLK